ncbi:MAG: hypothetical protein FWC77_02435 [Defluviitaleaceae bacterium]|nr:hypothetical protein [Defluviitaleaceae bacterium]
MKKSTKKLRSLLIVLALTVMVLMVVGCGGNNNEPASDDTPADTQGTGEVTGAETTPYGEAATSGRPETTLHLELFSGWGQRGGVGTGWFYEIIYDRFNIRINHLDDPLGGETLFMTRSAAGNLGDLVSIGRQQLPEVVTAGLLTDITSYVDNRMHFYPSQFPRAVEFARGLAHDSDNAIFALPLGASEQPPTNPSLNGPNLVRGPFLRWDAYQAIGAPTIYTLEDVLPVLRQMMDAMPTTADGRPTWGITLWSEWDSQGMANALWFDQMYGMGAWRDMMFISRYSDTWETWLDDGGLYHRILRFYFEANQMGVLDPDSATQPWAMAEEKANDGAILFSWYSWYGGAFNTVENLADGIGMQFVPIMDQRNVVLGMDPFGAEGQVMGIGSGVAEADVARLIDFIDWMASPEASQLIHAGPQGLTWDMVNGEPALLDFGIQAGIHTGVWSPEIPVPAEWGGGVFDLGSWSGLSPRIFQRGIEMNPVTGFPFDPRLWPSLSNNVESLVQSEWQARFEANSVMEFLMDHDMLVSNVATAFVNTDMPSNLEAIRVSLDMVMRTSPWRMIFASDEAEFDRIWREWQETAHGLGWQDLVDFHVADIELYFDARRETRAEVGLAPLPR